MDQDLSQLSRDMQKQVESNEKLIGMFANMLKRQDAADKLSSGRARAKGGAGQQFWEGVKKDFQETSAAIRGFDAAMAKAAGGVSGSLKLLSKDMAGASNAFQSLAKNVLGATIGGELIGGITQYTTGLISTYKDLSDYGQTFSDGMFGMAKAAMAGGVTLDEYSRLVKRNSTVMAQMGTKNGGLAGLASELRKNSEQFGMFGYTMAGLNDLAGDYMETMRVQGRLDKISKQDAVKNLGDLASETTLLSSIFGKSRKEITDTAQGVLRSASATIAFGNMTAEEAKRVGPGIEQAVTALAAQAGEAGKTLPKFLIDTIAANGNEVFTDTGKLVSALMPQAQGLTAKLAQDLQAANGDQAKIMRLQNDYIRANKAAYEANKQNLQIQHMAGGALGAQADQIIATYGSLKDLSDEDLEKAIERNKASAQSMKLWGSLENKWASFSSSIMLKIFPLLEEPLKAISNAFDEFQKNGGAKMVTDGLTKLGTAVSDFVNEFVKPKNMKAFQDKITEWLTELGRFIKAITGMIPEDANGSNPAAKAAGQGLFDTLSKLGPILDDVGATFKFLAKNIKWISIVLAGAAAAVGTAMLAFTAVNAFRNLKNILSMTVAAKNVYLNGDTKGLLDKLFKRRGGGGGEGGPHGPRGGGGGRGGWLGKVMKFGAAAGLAEGLEGVTEAVTQHVENAAEKAKPTEPKAGEAKAAEVREAGAAEVKPASAAEPAAPRTAATPEVGPEPARAAAGERGGLLGSIGGFFKDLSGANGLKGIASGGLKGLGVAGMLYDAYDGVMKTVDPVKEFMKDGNAKELVQSMITTWVPKVVGSMGAIALGTPAAALGTALGGPLGTAGGGLAGGYAGYRIGSAAGDGVAKDINGWIDKLTGTNRTAPNTTSPATSPTPTTPAPATLSDRQVQDIQQAQSQVTERMQNLERQNVNDDRMSQAQLDVLKELRDMQKDGTGVTAAFLQKIADAVKGGNRSIVNAVTSTPR